MDEECEVCAACARHGITDELRIEHIHKFMEAQAAVIDIISDAEDAGIDLDDPVVTEISDEIFGSPCDPSQLN